MKTTTVTTAASATSYDADTPSLRARTYAKITRRLVPFLMLCYLGAYLDRVNVGFAKLQMLSDLHWSDTVYGLGAGVFFIGYFLFEVPSNMILHRFGARRWLARIMITWAVISASFCMVNSPAAFYALRFVLGVAEAGFAPGVILYITYWFPSERRAKVMGMFFMAIPLASIIGAPLSGWILTTFAGIHGLQGWQWLFTLEALPSLLLGVAILLYLDDRVDDATWLTAEEKALLKRDIATENSDKTEHHGIAAFLSDRRLWLLTAIYFCIVMGQYGITFWLPTIVKNAGVTGMGAVGMLSAIPYLVALIFLPLVGRNSDRTKARRLHCAIPMLCAAGALFALPFTAGVPPALALLSVAAAGALCGTAQFWALPTAFLSGMTAAAGIATINCIANLAGFFSPSLVGWLNDVTGKQSAGLTLTSSMLLFGALLIALVPKQYVDR